MKLTKTKVFSFYAVLTIVLALIGLFVMRNSMPVAGLFIGVLVGVGISLALWFGYAKKKIESDSA